MPVPLQVRERVSRKKGLNVLKSVLNEVKSKEVGSAEAGRGIQSLPEEGMNDWEYVLVNSCIRKVNKMRVRERRKPCVMRPQEKVRYAVGKISRADSMKTAVEDNKRCNIPVVRKRLKTVKGEELIR